MVGIQSILSSLPFCLSFALSHAKIEDAPSRTMANHHRALRRQSNANVNNRIFSPFSSDYYCIYGLLPRHTDDDGRRVRFFCSKPKEAFFEFQ
jgi:hypothetical protein